MTPIMMMKTIPTHRFLALLSLLLLGMGMTLPVHAVIEIRVSVKIILDASDNRPTAGWDTDAEIEAEIDFDNQVLNSTGRGYQFVLTEIVELSGVSQWYSVAARNADNKNNLEDAAEANRSLYAYRGNAINVFLNNGAGSGVCSFPPTRETILIGRGAYQGLLLHEVGHFFNLCHTQGCSCGSCAEASGANCSTIPGDDNINDTLPDLQCWNRDQISQNAFGANYADLTADQQRRVDDTRFNIMSYHSNISILTPTQMDVWTDNANDSRAVKVSGATWYVDDDAFCLFPLGNRFCFQNVGGPFRTVLAGIEQAESTDIVLIRGGTYPETFISGRPVTLRNTRGSVLIGQ